MRELSVTISACSTGRSHLAECPVWDASRNRLLYLDLAEPTLIEWDETSQSERRHRLSLPPPLGGLCLRSNGTSAVFCRRGLVALGGNPPRPVEILARPDASFEVAPPNDLGVHPSGQVFVATADGAEKEPTGGLFFISRANSLQRLAAGYIVGNGPAFSADGRTVYVADSPQGVILAYDWNHECAVLDNRRVFAFISPGLGFPDGIAVDSEGGVWNALWGGGAVVRYSEKGEVSFRVSLPVRRVTSCAFGGPRLRTLYITTAREEGLQDGDLGGRLFSAEVGVSGMPSALAAI
jgi:sugar lactone lactonase YvrE